MIEFLKQSTFSVNEVMGKAWHITKNHYFSIALLCFLMFATLSFSSLMSMLLKDINPALNVLFFIIFITAYLIINLSLFKFIFHLLDHEAEEVSLAGTLPSKTQIIRFLIGSFYFTLCILAVYVVVALLVFPFIYTGIKLQLLVNLAISVGLVAIFVTWLRISFFPFFIIDKNETPFKSLKLSLAITKGNFTKILLLLFVLGFFQVMYLVLNYFELTVIATFVSILSSFVVVPLSVVALTVAYRKMMEEYKGTQEPDILTNII
ncbi:hypothetical protein BCY91_02500 [Pelobium manganitolerans]|uniref:Beta-carotene 15,15'-monooxygenase n=1 Tax=Pelobium manganitolerans TaxID=1842495 RepID=A0A419S6V5_9SPHI|nr:hypothetical protein [Pelobium manganitolerans]RKD17040.1 hypothetical protein BCY91_02500 [Pelobium manganitolerans]